MSAKPGASAATASSSSGTSNASAQEFVVRMPKEVKKRHSILKFHHSLKADLTKSGPLSMARENNLRDFKLSYDMDTQPKFGEGSEFGREQREEARRKKYGIYRKKYNPDDQPWLMRLGESKNQRRFKGVKEGTISDNVSYFVFTQCADGAFEAYPINDWYHFTPEIKYKCLSSEEAEEEFQRRDKTLNFFSIMVKKRLKNDDDEEDQTEEKEKKAKKGKQKKGFLLTDMDEWAMMSDGDVEDGDSETDATDKPAKPKKSTKKNKKKKFMKTNSDDEALEESDSVDEGNEVDYMTDSDSNDEDMYQEKGGDEQENKYREQGVEDEDGLKKLVASDDEDEENEDAEKEDKQDEGNDDQTPDRTDKTNGSDSESSASSDSDSDPEKDGSLSSALFLQKKSTEKKKVDAEKNRSRSATPTEEKAKKRKAESDAPAAKKSKLEPSLPMSGSSSNLLSEGAAGISEDAVRRYLMRKPMTTKDLLQKFKNKGTDKEQLVNSIAKILKRLDPEKTKVKDKLYLSIKKPD